MLKDIRERKGLTKAELSRLSGISAWTIFKIEEKRIVPKRSTLGRLAQALQVEIEEIER